MIDLQTVTDLQTAQGHWADTLAQEKLTMTTATYTYCLKGSQVVLVRDDGGYQVGVVNPGAVEWLANRLRPGLEKTLARIAGLEIGLEFVPLSGPPSEPEPAETLELLTGDAQARPSEAGLALASVNYYGVYFEAGGAGFNLIPHSYVYFWQFLLGPAFALWLYLMADEKTALTRNPATWWTQPRDYSFDQLTQHLNRKHQRYVAGDELECTYSRERRKEGRPLLGPADCCGGRKYEWLRFKKHSKSNGYMCLHWSAGLAETLARWQLAVIEVNEGYKCKIQTWRMLPHLTPYQAGLLLPAIQGEHEAWLRKNGPKSDPPIFFPFWETVTEENIVPLMPTHDQPEISHNFDQRSNYQEFLKHAARNPRWGQNGDEEGDDDA